MNRGRVRHMIANHDVALRAELACELAALQAQIEAAGREPFASEQRKLTALETRLAEHGGPIDLEGLAQAEQLHAEWMRRGAQWGYCNNDEETPTWRR